MKILPKAHSWVTDPDRRWFSRCDRCRKRRPVANYYEVYGTIDADHLANCPHCGPKGRQDGDNTWWWECTHCLIKTITDIAERALWKKP